MTKESVHSVYINLITLFLILFLLLLFSASLPSVVAIYVSECVYYIRAVCNHIDITFSESVWFNTRDRHTRVGIISGQLVVATTAA